MVKCLVVIFRVVDVIFGSVSKFVLRVFVVVVLLYLYILNCVVEVFVFCLDDLSCVEMIDVLNL